MATAKLRARIVVEGDEERILRSTGLVVKQLTTPSQEIEVRYMYRHES